VALLALEAVSLSHWRGENEIKALRGASLSVMAGELVAVYGRASTGKTTLLQLAAGLVMPDKGRVLFEGRDLSRCSARELVRLHRRQIAWVERSGPRSRDLPIATYVALSSYRGVGAAEARRRALAALDKVGALRCASQRWGELTDSERVLVAIAHALVRRPSLLITDDPTHGLGLVERERVVGLLRSMADDEGVGVLMTVPDMPATLPAHRVLLLNAGRVVTAPDSSGGGRDNVVAFPRANRGS
jgi:putative ABC transport system ATP-binding protein